MQTMQTLFVIGQIILGGYFLMAGAMHFLKRKDFTAYAHMKHLPLPSFSVALSGLALVLGGVGVLLQIAITWAYILLIVFLILAAFLMHNFWMAKDAQMKMADMVNFQKNLALAAALLMLLVLQA